MGLDEIVRKTSLHFCQSSLTAQFATLVLGRADQDGNVQLVNAGHTPVLLRHGRDVEIVDATSVPLGLFCQTDFKVVKLHVQRRGSLLLYSDGITESRDAAGNEYGLDRLITDVQADDDLFPQAIVEEISSKVAQFTSHSPLTDDRSILVLAR
jgi:phosphoserine phosphatase RsbU/P